MDSKILPIILLTSSIMLCCCENDESYISSIDDNINKPDSNIPHKRTKRCYCDTHDDKECMNFCELDIIW
ncbi:endothelin precursor [Deerpox virus W-848-83]|uniref:Endothelin n=1 Tax=Deerpox virus (strain Mule deer/United States/W-848-83/1983) TaxID=305674 RepID=Q08FZ4_DPV83|nr:Endothelin precursor [Deerpox virus W-848-83]ABI99163.1 endothelin precursor [Deerpox virus W-848-83]